MFTFTPEALVLENAFPILNLGQPKQKPVYTVVAHCL